MTSTFKIRIKGLFFYGIGFFLIIIIASPFILTRASNTAYIKNKISSFIYQKTGTHIDGSKFSLTLFPQVSLNINNFDINSGNAIDIHIESLKFEAGLKELFQGRINLDKITIEGPIMGAFNLNTNQSKAPETFLLSDAIQKISRLFDFLPEHQSSVELLLKNIKSPYFDRMDGFVLFSKEKQEIILDVTTKNIDINHTLISKDYFEKYLDVKTLTIAQLKSRVTISSKGEIQGKCRLMSPKLVTQKNHVVLDSNKIESSFKLLDGSYQIDMPPFQLNSPKGLVEIHFKNDKINKKAELQLSGTDIHVHEVRKNSLLVFKDNEVSKTLFEIILSGVAPRVDVRFQSSDLKDLFHEKNLVLQGNIENASIKIPETRLIASQVYGAAEIKKGVLYIKSSKGMVQSSKIEAGRLNIDLLNYIDYPFHGEFLLDLDLSMIPETLISLLPGTFLAKELLSVHDVTGRSKAKLNLSMKTKSNDLDVKIRAADFSVAGKYDRIPGNISIENVNFEYDPGIVSLKNMKGVINGNTIYDLNTKLDFKNKEMLNIQSGSGMIYMGSLISWLKAYKKTREMISPIKDANGQVYITSIDLSGPLLEPDQWKYDIKGNVDAVDLTTHLNQNQIENLSCQYHIFEDHFNLKKIQMKMNSLSWMEPFIEKKHLDSIFLPFDIENGNFQFNKNKSFFTSDLNFTTGLNLTIDLNGKTPSSFILNSIKFTDKDVSKGSISFDYNTDMPLYDFDGILNTTTLNKLVKPESFWANKINDFTYGQPILIKTDKDSSLNITIKQLNLNSLFSQSRKPSLDSRWLPDKIIKFKADETHIKKLTIKNMDSEISLKKDHAFIKFNKAFLCDMETSGYINLKKDSISINLPFEAKNKANIQNLLTCLFQKNEFMDGHYSLTFNIFSTGSKEDLFKKISGPIVFNAENGRIYKLTLLSRILSVLNVSNIFKGKIPNLIQDGFAYKNISIEADIKDSIIHLSKAIIDGQDMTLIFSGWIDPFNDKIDLTCLVAPFKTIDLIIENIPIINTLLGGRLVSVPVKASGKLSDPVVIPLHPSAVGKGLINMMSTILKTPVKLWDKIYSE